MTTFARFKKIINKSTKDGKAICEVHVSIPRWDKDAKKEVNDAKVVTYFEQRAEWASKAAEKFRENEGIILGYNEKNGHLYGTDTPRAFGFITTPPTLREASKADKAGAVAAVNEAANAGGLAGYEFNTEDIEEVKNAYALMSSLDGDLAKDALKWLRKLMYAERNTYIGKVANPSEGNGDTYRVAIAMPKKTADEPTQWATVTFFRDEAAKAKKVLKKGARAVLFLGEKTEKTAANGKTYVNFLGNSFTIVEFAPKEESNEEQA